MNELEWRRIENRLVEAHRADPPLSPAVWRGIEARLAERPPPRRARLALGARLVLGAVVLAAAAVALWWRPAPPTPRAPLELPSAWLVPPVPPVPAPIAPPAPPPVAVLNAVLEPRAPITLVMSVDDGRIELEPCRGRFVNVTLLEGPHQRLELREQDRRVEVTLDGGPIMRGGVAHILVPADTRLELSTRRGAVVVRGLGGPMQIATDSGAVTLDTAPRLDPIVTVTTDSGAITWRGRCAGACRVDARSRTGDITLRAADRPAFTRGAARGESQAGRVHLEELTCSDPRCSSSPLPWRQPAAATHP